MNINEINIKPNDIVKHENLKTGEVRCYYADIDTHNYIWLYLCDSNGRIDREGLNNIKLTKGVSLYVSDISKWSVVGSKEEVYKV